MLKTVLIANRGEIAVRIIHACRRLGIRTVAVYSEADRESLHVKLADRAICIGPAKSKDSYLKIVNIVSAAEISEAGSAFGDNAVYLEKFIARARHVEIQVLADAHGNVVHLGERDCSMQRRHQKLIEESPSPAVDPDLRRRMGEAAVRAAKAVGYVNAGTVEFILCETGEFYFMEMNTRIQVEHPVTEMVTGIDLVEQQLRIASGGPLPFSQDDITFNGHAIECRLNAEDPDKGFRPCPGTISRFMPPWSNGCRLDTHLYTGYKIPVHYDSLLAKLIVHKENRQEAIEAMLRALEECVIEGVSTTIPFHRKLLTDAAFSEGRVHTKYVEEEFTGR